MEYKYKLSEQEQRQTLKPKDVPSSLLKRMEDLYGPVDLKNDFFSSDFDTYYKTIGVNKETGGVNHKVIALASFEESLKQITSAYETLKDLLKADEAKNDSNIVDVSKDIKNALNKYRAHLRKFYPEQYKKAMSRMDEGEIDEISTSAGAGAYLTKYAFKLPKKKQKDIVPEGDTYEKMAAKGKKAGSLKQGTVRKRLGIKKGEKIPLSLINKELARLKKMDKDDDKKGVQLGDKNQKYYKALQLSKTLKTTTNVNEDSKNPGATLGPGPTAGEDGVRDNAYVKQFKYKLVPKKNGTYVQKGSGLEVKKLY